MQPPYVPEKECSNRTFMELKLPWRLISPRTKVSSNRTFMELKSRYYFGTSEGKRRSNRTFMELKYLSFSLQACQQSVLIVPLWN